MSYVGRYSHVYIALAMVGAVIAAILTSFHFSTGAEANLCSTAAGCHAVNESQYSTVAGVPIALMGLGSYLVIAALAAISIRSEEVAEWASLAIFGISLIGVLYSAYLTYLELFVIHAVCPWCVGSAAVMIAIWLVSMSEMSRDRRAAQRA
ncbi:MAG: vitamin K epoxide reductase family protein [Anaerolineae bacterium]